MRAAICLILVFFTVTVFPQDSAYTRKVIAYLTSEKCYGRGYLKKGLSEAEKFLVNEIRSQNLKPLFGNSFTQSFFHSVNTFPKHCELKINGKEMKAGFDFIPDPSAHSAKGTFKLFKKDSLHFVSSNPAISINLRLKKKLTYSVSDEVSRDCSIEVDKNRLSEEPYTIELNIKNVLLNNFESKNIACYLEGSSASDSLIVFSAHYDHLGGLGKSVYFPGANDNASGVSMVLNLLKYYKTHPPKYKAIFIFFAGEEAGLLGSKFFVESGALDLKKVKFLVNLDLLGTGEDGIMVVNGAIHTKQFERLTELNSKKHLVKEVRKRGKASNSDHFWFSEAGVPCFFIYTMGGIAAYHDVYDLGATLPLTDYQDVFSLLTDFIGTF